MSEGLSIGGLRRGWNKFFWSEIDSKLFALFRIGTALILLVDHFLRLMDLELFFTASGLVPRSLIHLIEGEIRPSYLTLFPDEFGYVNLFAGIFLFHILCLLLGFFTGFSSLMCMFWITAFQHRNMAILDGADGVIRFMTFFVILMPAAHRWSLDAVFRRRRGLAPFSSRAPVWPLRLVQVQMCLIFLSAAFSKMRGEAWLDGGAMYFVAHLSDLWNRLVPSSWFLLTPFTRITSWSVVLGEFLIPILIWFRELRRPCLLLALFLHLLIEGAISTYLFQWAMLVGWLAFLTDDDLVALGISKDRKERS